MFSEVGKLLEIREARAHGKGRSGFKNSRGKALRPSENPENWM
jgi:hypothetical protein